MTRLVVWAGIGEVIGFLFFAVLFKLTWPMSTSESLLWIGFAIMGAIPVALFAVIFSAIRMVKHELDEIRRELLRFQRTEGLVSAQSPSSTQFRAGFTEGIRR